jgi:DNA-binding MarR family transcriptional regulator
MSDPSLTARVESLVVDHIESIQQLEVLLLLATSPGRAWLARTLADELRTSRASVLAQLEKLCSAGLIASAQGNPEPAFRFDGTAEQGEAILELVALYPQFRVRISQLIYRRRPSATG